MSSEEGSSALVLAVVPVLFPSPIPSLVPSPSHASIDDIVPVMVPAVAQVCQDKAGSPALEKEIQEYLNLEKTVESPSEAEGEDLISFDTVNRKTDVCSLTRKKYINNSTNDNNINMTSPEMESEKFGKKWLPTSLIAIPEWLRTCSVVNMN